VRPSSSCLPAKISFALSSRTLLAAWPLLSFRNQDIGSVVLVVLGAGDSKFANVNAGVRGEAICPKE
jgi:hypothetical protein